MEVMKLKMNGFHELNENELMEVDGGVVITAGGIVAGIAISAVFDGGLKAITGKSSSDWVAIGIQNTGRAISNLLP